MVLNQQWILLSQAGIVFNSRWPFQILHGTMVWELFTDQTVASCINYMVLYPPLSTDLAYFHSVLLLQANDV